MKEINAALVVVMFLIGFFAFAVEIEPARSEWFGTAYIRADGSVDPVDAPIQRDGGIYTLVGDITSDYDGIVVERDNVVLDGAGHTVTCSAELGDAGIFLFKRSGVTIRNTNINGFAFGIYMINCSYTSIVGNNMTANWCQGIESEYSNSSVIFQNNIAYGDTGMVILDFDSIIEENRVEYNNNSGVNLGGSRNILRKNTITGNGWHPIIPKRGYGVYLAGSNNSVVGNSVTANNGSGIWLEDCYDSIVDGNNITGNVGLGYGIVVLSGGNTISRNNIVANPWGIVLEVGLNCFYENNVTASTQYGIALYGSGNYLFHNNFDNVYQVYVYYGSGFPWETWDDGYPSGGNYWSDYAGMDIDGDGLGETPYYIDANNQDNYPLLNPWIVSESTITVNGEGYPVTIASNTTTSEAMQIMNTLKFVASGPEATTGYIRIVFPMINATAIKTYIDNAELVPPPFPTTVSNGTHYFIYFEFTLSTHEISIKYGIAGDINLDNIVNIKDATQIGINWLQIVPPVPPNVDINSDGIVNIKDATIVGLHWLDTG